MEQYKIVIGTDGESTQKKKKTPIAGDNTESKQTSENDSAKKDLAGYFAYKKYVSPFLSQGLQHRISTVELRTGNAERQARMQSAYSIGSQALGLVESIVIGAKLGGGAGAVIGAVMSVSTTVMSYVYKADTINLQRGLENQTIAMLNVRSGAVNGNRR